MKRNTDRVQGRIVRVFPETNISFLPVNKEQSSRSVVVKDRGEAEKKEEKVIIVLYKGVYKKKNMAKTRIKTTPTRMQKDALMGSTTVTTITNAYKTRGSSEDTLKKRLLELHQKKSNASTIDLTDSTIIVHAPKRTNSISSATSTLSHASDGGQTDIEFLSSSPIPTPSPPATAMPTLTSDDTSEISSKNDEPTMDELTENAIKTLNAGLQSRVMNGRSALAAAIKNRKVFMITEKNYNGNNLNADSQKRKMYLIMEDSDNNNENDNNYRKNPEKWLKMDNGYSGNTRNGSNCKKLTLFADKCDGQLPQQIEKILPEILNRIQAKNHDNSILMTNTSTNKIANISNANTNLPNVKTTIKKNVISMGIDRTLITTDSNDSDEMLLNMNQYNKSNQHDNAKLLTLHKQNIMEKCNSNTRSSSSSNSNSNSNNNNNNISSNNNNERLPLTLPPKKNRNKIINTQIIPVMPQKITMEQQQQQQQQHHQYNNNNQSNHYIKLESNDNNDNDGTDCIIYDDIHETSSSTSTTAQTYEKKTEDEINFLTEEIFGATPVIVALKQQQQQQQQQHQHHQQQHQHRQPYKTIGSSKTVATTAVAATAATAAVTKPTNLELFNDHARNNDNTDNNNRFRTAHKNINLSPDFLFLMKMLPKLESVPEPHKSHLKNCIEEIITQNANKFGHKT